VVVNWLIMLITSQFAKRAIHFICRILGGFYSYGHSLTYGHQTSPMKMRQLRERKNTLKMLPVSWFLVSFFERFRSFVATNIKSVGQRASKLLAVKVWGWFDPRRSRIWAEWFEWGWGRFADFFLRPPTLTAIIYDLQTPSFLQKKDLILFPKYSKIQEAGSTSRVSFALPKSSHPHRGHPATVRKRMSSMSVY